MNKSKSSVLPIAKIQFLRLKKSLQRAEMETLKSSWPEKREEV